MPDLMASAVRVSAARFRSLMTSFPTGVAVVTAVDDDGDPWGMTCSSVCGVSIDPPTLLVCLRRGSPTLAAVLARASFAVNLLSAEGRATAELFASGDPHRFDRVPWRPGTASGNPHLVRDAHTVADCRVSQHHDVGDHTVVFGEVCLVCQDAAPHPLLYGLRRYREWMACPETAAS